MTPDPPLQPMIAEPGRGGRFRENALVTYLLERASQHGCDLNHLATVPASEADREQFAMLIGYSLSGFLELSYVREETATRAIAQATHDGLIDPDKHFWWQGD